MNHAYIEYRQKLLRISARLDQMLAEADIILSEPGDEEIGLMAEDLREWVVEMLDRVDDKIERGMP